MHDFDVPDLRPFRLSTPVLSELSGDTLERKEPFSVTPDPQAQASR